MSEETIADILAEMFDFSDKRIEEGRDHAMTSESVGLIVYQLAKRFGAAWKRESAGNAAAMREALERLASIDLGEDVWDDNGADGRKLHDAVIEARTALSAPARNCDRFDNWYDAHQAWERLPKDELGYFVAANGVHECEQAWLFAPAERKGEGDSNGN